MKGPEVPDGNIGRYWALLVLALLVFVVIIVFLLIPFSGEGDRYRFSKDEIRKVQPGGMTPERLRLLGRKIDLNAATLEELSKVKGIGPRLAPEVIAMRERKGRFISLEELFEVRGIGRKRFEQARNYLEVRPAAQPAPPDPRAMTGFSASFELNFGPTAPPAMLGLLPRSYEPSIPAQLFPEQINPARGTRQAMAILVSFSDTTTLSTTTTQYFSDLLFRTWGSGPYPAQTLTQFYQGMSGGVFTLTGRVAGWFTASGSHDYYGCLNSPDACQKNGFGYYGGTPQLVGEAITLAEASGVDFSWVRRDSNNIAQDFSLFVVHQGLGAEQSFTPTDIWSASEPLFPGVATTSGLIITRAIIVPEQTIFPEFLTDTTFTLTTRGPIDIGVFAHELGHDLGLPDLYDTDLSSYGVGEYCLMSYGYAGPYPSILSAWPRVKLGWARTLDLTESLCEQTFTPTETGGPVLKAWGPGPAGNEYFLLEEREWKGNPKINLSSVSGLLIWHVDETVPGNACEWCNGYCGTGHCSSGGHYLVALDQADGLFDLERKMNRGDPFDVYLARTAFDKTTVPSSMSYVGDDTGISVKGISKVPGAVLTANVLLAPLQPPAIVSLPANEAMPGTPFTYQAFATGTGLHWFLASGPSGMTVDPRTGLLSWTSPRLGRYSVDVVVSNCLGYDEQVFNLAVGRRWDWSNGDCLLSALTVGTPLQAALNPMRAVRDKFLARFSWGRALIRAYYAAGSLILSHRLNP